MPLALSLTTVAMIAFAANSILARLALGAAEAGAADYTALRMVSGAAVLAVLIAMRGGGAALRPLPGSWRSAAALFGYAILFSFAYLELGAAMGALILFAAVQATMVGWGFIGGNRPLPLELAGLAVAFGAFLYLLLPGADAPDLSGSLLMVASGISWGLYSLRGRSARDPLRETAGNFVRTVPMCLPLLPLAAFGQGMTWEGAAYAVASGALASGLGYAVWYRALPSLSATQAGVVQLTVPVIAAAGAVLFLAEEPSPRLWLAGGLILGGVGLAIAARRPRPAAA